MDLTNNRLTLSTFRATDSSSQFCFNVDFLSFRDARISGFRNQDLNDFEKMRGDFIKLTSNMQFGHDASGSF